MNAQDCVLVTGGSGFIGSWLVQHFLATQQFKVRAPKRRLANESVNSAIIPAPDLGPNANWADALHGVDYVVHCAGTAHKRSRRASLEGCRHVNTYGALRLAEQAADAGVRRFVFLSSVGVHGQFVGRPFRETDECAPRAAYAISKYEAELGLQDLATRTGMETVIIRPPLVHGPDAPGNFGKLLRLARSGCPLPFGLVNNRRSILGVSNLSSLIQHCLLHPRAANEVFLASDDRDISTAAMIRILRDSLEQARRIWPFPPSLLEFGATALGQQQLYDKMLGDLIVDSSKARRLLNWLPPLTVEQGLAFAALGRTPASPLK